MTETGTRDPAAHTLSVTSETMGHDFLAAMLGVLRAMPDHWERLNAERQQKIVDALKEKIQTGIKSAVNIMLRSEFPAIVADLEQVTWKSGLAASLKIPRNATYRHNLADAVGEKVLIVIADPDRWMNRMDEIKAKENQLELFTGDYDPAIDQPGYRRDRDATALGAPSWEDLKSSLKGHVPKLDEAQPAETSTEDTDSSHVEDSAAGPEGERRITHAMIQEGLAALHVTVSLGTIGAWSPAMLTATQAWAEAYASNPEGCPVARPLWLPIPEPKGESDAQ